MVTSRSGTRSYTFAARLEAPALDAILPLTLQVGGAIRWHSRLQFHGGADEILQRLLVDLIALVEIDLTPDVALEAGVEEA